MEGHNARHTPVTSDGKLSVVLENYDGTPAVVLKKAFLNDHLRKVLSAGPLTPEQLADILEEPHTRRAWWLDLHSSADFHAGTTISDLEQAVISRESGTAPGSVDQPAAAPVFVEYVTRETHPHMNWPPPWEPPAPVCHVEASNALTMPVCECSQPVASIVPFDWQCAKCKGVIPSPYVLTDEQRRDYLEAL